MLRWVAAIVAWSMAATATAVTIRPNDRIPAVLTAVTDCRTITDDKARLACFDGAAAALITATTAHDIVVFDREAVQATRRGLFGFTIPKLPFFNGGKNDDAPEFQTLDAVVQTARSVGYGMWRLTLDDGAVWTTSEEIVRRQPRAGSKVHIVKAALGSYFITVDSGSTVRAKRENSGG